jgi:prephenate dehydrogenase
MKHNSKHLPATQKAYQWVPTSLKNTRVAIWGMGLMGGSLAMALHGKTAALYGIDPDPQVCMLAEELEIFDRISSTPAELLPLADLVLLASPLEVLPNLIESLPLLHPGSAVVMDIGSTKTKIVEAMGQLPERFAPIGGHPMCGKEVSGLAHASVSLYQGASFALLPLPRTPQSASDLALQLVQAVGAHPEWMDPLTHDRWVASTSHLPYLVANCLSCVIPLEAAPMIGPGFTSTSRLAGEPVDMMIDILNENRANILVALKAFRYQLERIEQDLEASNFVSLHSRFEEGANQHAAILNSFFKGGHE